jgi:aspartate/methionine/tyrosine aminotransferase
MITDRAIEIPPFIVMDILEKAQKMEKGGKEIIHLEVGEPDFDTPKCIVEASLKALKDGKTRYTSSLGLLELREAISENYYEKYRVSISPDQIIITSGSSAAMLLLFLSIIEKGDEIILPDPHYPCYPNFIKFLGGTPIFVNIYESDGFQYRVEDIKNAITKRTKGILINSPSNPTGAVLSKNIMEEIAKLGLFVISDEIYNGLIYEGEEHTMAEFTDKLFIISGFSKLYAMTGWRLGYIIIPEDFIRPMQKIHQNFFISANSFVQWGAIAAIKEAKEDVNDMKRIYNERRKFIIKRLRDIDFGIRFEPKGAFYVLANAKKFSNNSYKFAMEILENIHVGVTPGIDFGSNAEGYIRFSYANSIENISIAMDRLYDYLIRREEE